MNKLAYYITTHGFGHATRSVAIIRDLLLNTNIEIHVCSYFPEDILKKWFQSEHIKYHKVETLFGVCYKDLIEVDLNESINIFKNGIKKQTNYIKQESAFCRKNNIELLISDICPYPFDVAEKLKIPAIAISNFNWYSIFKHIIKQRNSSELERDLEILKKSYEKSEILLQLPFSIDMGCFKKIKKLSLVVREITRNNQEIRNLLNINKDDFIIFFGLTDFKFSTDKLIKKFNNVRNSSKNLKILFSSFLKPHILNDSVTKDYFRFIPEDDQESHDYLAASDIVIGKVGYGTVSECIAYEKPFIYTTRKDFIEDIALSNGIETFGRGKYYPANVLLNGDFENLIITTQQLSNNPIKKQLAKNGTLEITNFLKDFF